MSFPLETYLLKLTIFFFSFFGCAFLRFHTSPFLFHFHFIILTSYNGLICITRYVNNRTLTILTFFLNLKKFKIFMFKILLKVFLMKRTLSCFSHFLLSLSFFLSSLLIPIPSFRSFPFACFSAVIVIKRLSF